MCDVLVTFCMVLFMLLCQRNFHLFGGAFCFGVASEVSGLSRGAGLLLFGSWCGIGGCGGSLFGLLGFS